MLRPYFIYSKGFPFFFYCFSFAKKQFRNTFKKKVFQLLKPSFIYSKDYYYLFYFLEHFLKEVNKNKNIIRKYIKEIYLKKCSLVIFID
jgi:hypothetical protein